VFRKSDRWLWEPPLGKEGYTKGSYTGSYTKPAPRILYKQFEKLCNEDKLRKELHMKYMKWGCIVLLLLGVITTVSATTVKRGEKWDVEYAIIWEDTKEVVLSGVLHYEHTKAGTITLEDWARSQLGFSKGNSTKRVTGKIQRLILSCRQVE
jgi:hypothetical protein